MRLHSGLNRPGLAVLLIALSPLGVGAALSDNPRSSRQQASSNGIYSIRFVRNGPKDCRIEVFADLKSEWQLAKCLGSAEDFFFVSNDAGRFWVIRAIPERPRLSRGREGSALLMNVQVATLYDREGRSLKRMKLANLMQRKSRDKVRQLGSHFEWLQGVGGVPGRAPRVNDENEVELDLMDSRTVRLKF